MFHFLTQYWAKKPLVILYYSRVDRYIPSSELCSYSNEKNDSSTYQCGFFLLNFFVQVIFYERSLDTHIVHIIILLYFDLYSNFKDALNDFRRFSRHHETALDLINAGQFFISELSLKRRIEKGISNLERYCFDVITHDNRIKLIFATCLFRLCVANYLNLQHALYATCV